jgi:hypothetical protein
MSIVTRTALFAKVRKLSASPDTSQLPDFANPLNPLSAGIADYVNSFYNYDFPAQFRSLKLKDTYTFNTVYGVDTYPFNSEQYTTIEQPCYCAKREILLCNDPWSFFGLNYNWQQQDTIASGKNTAGPYSGYTTANPLIRSVNNNPATAASPNVPGVSQGYSGFPSSRVQNILITANVANGNTVNVTDDGNGNLIGNCLSGGTINYATGQVANLTFTQVIPQANPINMQYNPVTPSIPLSILFYQNQFVLRPVPDQGYTIELTAYRQPTQALTSSAGGTPELSEWWECIAVGAAKKIYEDRLDMDGVAMMDKMLQERYQMVYTRTYAQLGKQRIQTLYTDQLTHNYGANGWGFGSGAGA